MDAYEYDYQVLRPEKEFPIARTRYTKPYLDAGRGAFSLDPVADESKATYEAREGRGVFTFTFQEDTEITGYPNCASGGDRRQ